MVLFRLNSDITKTVLFHSAKGTESEIWHSPMHLRGKYPGISHKKKTNRKKDSQKSKAKQKQPQETDKLTI